MINKSRRTMVLVYFPINFLLSVLIIFSIYTQIIQPYILSFIEIIFIIFNFVIVGYIEIYMNKELKKKNEIIVELKKSIILQEEFIVNVSHELKTPLNVISSAVQLFKSYCFNGSLDEKRQTIIKYLDSMKLNSYRLSKLINNIVDSSKVKSGCFELHLSNNNIVEAIEGIVMSITSFIESKGIDIVFDTDIEEKIISYDPEKIERIVLNLLSNAIKFSDKGDEILVEVKDKNEFVEISVIDNGIGIEKNQLDMIFNRFKQVNKSLSRNAEGTGIGLSLVKSIVELQGGSISVESEVGKGSRFTVLIPAVRVSQENMMYSRNVKSSEENIRIEFSDIDGLKI